MRYLIVSDIHGNWEALQAVLHHAAGEYDRILCCGDLVGYGGDPNAVVDWARTGVSVIVRGNHDRACVGLEDLEWFNPVARAAAIWTREQLSAENIAWIHDLPKGPVDVDGFQVLHGSPLNEDEYLVEPDDAIPAFSYLEARLAFFGHTHLQGGFIWSGFEVQAIGKPDPVRQEKMLLEFEPDSAYLINPGSVGQPRDGDARAGFVLYDPADGFLFYHRIPYDVEAAQASIRRAGLPEPLASRLAWGK